MPEGQAAAAGHSQVTSQPAQLGGAVLDGASEFRRDDHIDAREGRQPPHVGPLQRLQRDHALEFGDLAGEEVDLPQPGVDGLALLDRSSSAAGQRRPLMRNRSLAGRQPCMRRTSTAWASFLTRMRAVTSCARRHSRRRITRVRSSGSTARNATRPLGGAGETASETWRQVALTPTDAPIKPKAASPAVRNRSLRGVSHE
jgi:hypothetical protein